MNEKTSKALGLVIGGLVEFFINWGIVRLVWNSLLTQLFHLQTITWFQALLIIWFCEALFKTRKVTIAQDLTK